MNKFIPEIDTRGLREFGFVTATLIALVFGIFFPVIVFGKPFPELPAAFQVSIGLGAIALVLPIILKPVYIVWMGIAAALGWINTRILMAIVFYLLFTPVAVLLKLLRIDPLHRSFNPGVDSYKQSSTLAPKQQMERPY
ncbi:MAG: SxtJ family membrane protein [Gammaproteobacteria bacterium]